MVYITGSKHRAEVHQVVGCTSLGVNTALKFIRWRGGTLLRVNTAMTDNW